MIGLDVVNQYGNQEL